MKNISKISILCLLFLLSALSLFSYAVEFGYQGTHVLTHDALEDLAKAFHTKYGMPLTVKGGGCDDGIAAVTKDRYEMGGICCPLNPKTAKKHGMIAHKVAVDIKAVMVNPKNPVKGLTLKQVSEIHNGAITNWKQLGGLNKPIALVFREHCRDKEEPVRNVLGIKGAVAGKAIIVKTDMEVVEYVERFPNAVGVTSRIFAEKAKVKMITINGISPTPENTENGLYKLKGDLYIITRGQPADWTKKFIDFILSDEGQAIIGKRFARVNPVKKTGLSNGVK